jgi:hypothetical protein
MFCESRFGEHKREDHDPTHCKQAYDLGRVPGKDDSTEIQTEQNHESESRESQDTNPVNGFYTADEGSVFVLGIQKKHNKDSGNAHDR